MEVSDTKELAQAMKAGFSVIEAEVKELKNDFNKFTLERAKEQGFELKEKVSKQSDALVDLEKWKVTTDQTLITLRRVSWGLAGAVGTIFLMIAGALITYFASRLGK